MKLRGGNTTRKNSKGKINIDDLYDRLVNENMNKSVVRANSTRRKQANTVKQSKPVTNEATRGIMESYAIRHNRANKKKTRSRSKTKSRLRSESRTRPRGRSRGRSRSKIVDNKYNPYDSSSELGKLMNNLANKSITLNKNRVIKVKQSKGMDAPGTFGRSNR
tara:strand:+ start:703 stop:1191 length:489 start_codon:yes stop_codon:yes gene_type:complete